MRHEHKPSVAELEPVEVRANPPPFEAEAGPAPLFQTMSELHARHGTSRCGKELLSRAAWALILGSAVFGSLYLIILFVE